MYCQAKRIRHTAWLLLVLQCQGAAPFTWSHGAGFRAAPLQVAGGGQNGFTAMPPEKTTVGFTNELRGDLRLTNAVAHNGAGVTIGDVDTDGWPDLYFCCLQGPNRLYRNLGNWRFAEMPLGEAACAGQLSTAAAFADVDGDAHLDLLVNGIAAGTRLFLGDGQGTWTETNESGLSRTASTTSLALADIDGDGDLDLYCTHYIDVMHLADPTTRFALAREGDNWRISQVNGEPATLPYWKDRFEMLPGGRVRELPETDGFYRNEGGGRFTSIGSTPGMFRNAAGTPVGPFRDWGLSVMFRDLNGDHAPDLYVCNDNASPDRLWLNNGDGTFRAPGTFVFRHTTRSSMALDFADVDRDGRDDLLVLDMLARSPARRLRQLVRTLPDPAVTERAAGIPRYNRNMLFLGRADGSFAEVALQAGLAATDWSWCPIFLDVDLDGYEDLLVSNGFEFDVMDRDSHDRIRGMRLSLPQRKRLRQFHPPWPTPNLAFRNRRDGTFEPAGEAWGFNRTGVSNGMAAGDLDNDGDLDVVVNNLNEVAGLYRNNAGAGRVAVRLKGLPPNTAGIGATLRLSGGPVAQTQEMMAGGRYLSCDQAVRVFAAEPDSDEPLRLEVDWRNGDRTSIAVRPNTICEVLQPDAGEAAPPVAEAPESEPWFTEVSALLGHMHVEDEFDDWAIQPLLPCRLSRLGPGLSWFDLNGDGWEDLTVSAARGGRLSVFLSEQGRDFRRLNAETSAPNDQGGLVGWVTNAGRRALLVAESNYNFQGDEEAALGVYTLTNRGSLTALSVERSIPLGNASPGPLALADVDGDGDLDLFVGGRFRPGRYPEPVSSTLWLNQGGVPTQSTELSQPFASVGLVSGATFADLDGDGDPDLALAVDWGPVRVFSNGKQGFEEVTDAWGLAARTGRWTGITAGDFNGDGRLDLAAGNWGRNSLSELDHPEALRLFYDDGDGDGPIEVIEAWSNGAQWYPLRPRPWLARGFPDLPRRIPTHEAYGQATVREVWPDGFSEVRTIEARHFESAVFLNRGSNFECRPLPREAQRTPAFGVSVGDFNGDGLEDLFLSQNFFGGGSDLSREDAGRGQWLQGRGDGTFEPVETGVVIHGEQRAAALADFDHDGRVDLTVTQNSGGTKLYRNERARQGLRVVLRGVPGNPSAVGAQLRVRFAGGRLGPCRTIQAGSGYWSQDGTAQVLGLADVPEALWIRWPDGNEQVVPLQRGQLNLSVTFHNGGKQE